MSPLYQSLLSILFGAIAGGITNAVAVWMLFHPYEPPRLFGRRINFLQGAIPKNKVRLASSMGRTVGNKLLTPEDLARTLAEPGFREAFDDRLSAFVRSLIDQRRGSLSELLPAELTVQLRGLLDEVAGHGVGRLQEYVRGAEFEATAQRWAASLAEELRDERLGDVLTPEREAALAAAADRWIADAVDGEGFAAAVRDYLDRGAHRLLKPGRTFQELLPMGLVASVERAIAGYMPFALEHLGGLLEDPEARSRVQRVLHEILDRFMRDLKFHQRIVAALIITPETVDRVLAAIEAEGATRIAELLQDPAIRDAMARGVNNAIVDFLARPVVAVLGDANDPPVQEAQQTMEGWVLSLARDAQTRSFLVEKLQTTLALAERRTWGDVFRHLPPERLAEAVIAAARSERAGTLYRDMAARMVTLALERPIGRVADHMPVDASDRIERAIAPPLWAWLQEQVPAVAQRVDIARKVEQKILDYPTYEVEMLIRGVTERELRLIVQLGYVLGAAIGVVSAVIGLLFS